MANALPARLANDKLAPLLPPPFPLLLLPVLYERNGMAEPGVAGNAASDGSELAPEEHVDVSGESAAAPLLLLARCWISAGSAEARDEEGC